MENFTPWSALIGGILIGISAVLMLWLNGRIAGISGILGGLVFRQPGDWGWRLSFVAGLVAGGGVYALFFPAAVAPDSGLPGWMLVAGGVLVGFGTRMGSGCTSGHGVCGIGRFSLRSIAATGMFMLAGMVSVFVVRHLPGIAS